MNRAMLPDAIFYQWYPYYTDSSSSQQIQREMHVLLEMASRFCKQQGIGFLSREDHRAAPGPNRSTASSRFPRWIMAWMVSWIGCRTTTAIPKQRPRSNSVTRALAVTAPPVQHLPSQAERRSTAKQPPWATRSYSWNTCKPITRTSPASTPGPDPFTTSPIVISGAWVS